MTTSNRTPWDASHYSPFAVTGSGASKLAASGVAPLVAAARGYKTFNDLSGAKVVAERAALSSGAMSLRTKLKTMVASEGSDVLSIPWYGVGSVLSDELTAVSRTTQLRPSHPLVNAAGKPAKYEFLPGEATKLDVNPATPAEWFSKNRTVLLTEGCLKGDAALTALLIASGVSAAQLTFTDDPRERLSELMRGVDPDFVIPIVSFAGVANWHGQADWRHVSLKHKRVIVAFDGDTASNYNVHKQATALFDFVSEKGGNPAFLNLSSLTAEMAMLEAGHPVDSKLGIDDYVATVGDWNSLMSLVEGHLPASPERPDTDAPVGTWRVNPTQEWIVEELTSRVGPDGSSGAARWEQRAGVGGRIQSVNELRVLSREEMRTGVVSTATGSISSSTVCVELTWLDVVTEVDVVTAVVTGPTEILAYPPAEWDRRGAKVPDALLMHPEWPPRHGSQWLAAVKSHRPSDIHHRTAFDAMGWVPVKGGGTPVFIIGDQVLGQTTEHEMLTMPGVTEAVLPKTSNFRVTDRYRELADADYKAEVLSDIEALFAAYVDGGAYKSHFSAVAVVAAMFRPTIPLPTCTSLYIYGPPRAGKSFTAAHVMAAWGLWTLGDLPGSAEDTLASTEFALARTVAWVADDLAPSRNTFHAEQTEAKIGDVIRAVHNGSPRRKMNGSTGAVAPQSASNVLFIVTAEHQPTVASIRERVIAINTPKGAFGDSAAVGRLNQLIDDGIPRRLTAALIRFWLNDNEFGTSWLEKTTTLNARLQELTLFGSTILQKEYGMREGETVRHSQQASELSITLEVIGALAEAMGMRADHPLLERLGRGKGSYLRELYAGAARTMTSQEESRPGKSLLTAIHDVLAAGSAHVENPNGFGQPPLAVQPGSGAGEVARIAAINRALGWSPDSQGVWTPRGLSLGFFGVTPSGEQVVLLNAQNAFNTAKRLHPDRILGGSNASGAWSSVWGEGFTSSRTKRQGVVTVEQVFGDVKRAGVPVLLDALLNDDFVPVVAAAD